MYSCLVSFLCTYCHVYVLHLLIGDFFLCYLGKSFCMAQIEELCANPVLLNSSEQIQNIVMFLQRSEALSKHVDSFMQMLSFVQSNDVAPFVLTPFLSDELREANFLR